MNDRTLKHLNKLAKRSRDLGEFFAEVSKWPRRYGVPFWSKADYEKAFLAGRSSTGLTGGR